MRESKRFFQNNKLNKGYKRRNNRDSDKQENLRQVDFKNLPPIEVLEEYEALYPGTFNKLIEMTEKEQLHRHQMEVAAMNDKIKLCRYGYMANFLYILITSCTAIYMLLQQEQKLATIFVICAFGALGLIAFLFKQRSAVRNNHGHKHYHKPQKGPYKT